MHVYAADNGDSREPAAVWTWSHIGKGSSSKNEVGGLYRAGRRPHMDAHTDTAP